MCAIIIFLFKDKAGLVDGVTKRLFGIDWSQMTDVLGNQCVVQVVFDYQSSGGQSGQQQHSCPTVL